MNEMSMKPFLRLLLSFSLVLHSFPVLADIDRYLYFDFAKCQNHSISNERMGDDNPDFVRLEKRAHELSRHSYDQLEPDDWYAFSGDNDGIGICRTTKAMFQCTNDSYKNFPLSGTSYQIIKDRGNMPSFLCVKGCNPLAPRIIHRMFYEPLETDRNIELNRAARKFKKQCLQK